MGALLLALAKSIYYFLKIQRDNNNYAMLYINDISWPRHFYFFIFLVFVSSAENWKGAKLKCNRKMAQVKPSLLRHL